MRFKVGLAVALVALGAGLWYAWTKVRRDSFPR